MTGSTQDLAASIAERSRIKNPAAAGFRKKGEMAARTLATEIERNFGLSPALDILDFGAATGRITLPLASLLPQSRIFAIDVDAEAIQYLRGVVPTNCECLTNKFEPPTIFADGRFDCVFAISVWSHFSDELGFAWLQEMKRIVKPGALLLITTLGQSSFLRLREHNPKFAAIPSADFERRRYIFHSYGKFVAQDSKWPGIASGSTWGMTVIHPSYIRERWSALFDIVDIRERGLPGLQDLVVMRSPLTKDGNS